MKYIFALLCLTVFYHINGQEISKFALLGSIQLNQVLYDKVNPDHKPTGFGAGIQMGYRNLSIFEPIFDISLDIIEGDNISYPLYEDKDVTKHIAFNLFWGGNIKIAERWDIELVLGASFTDRYLYFGYKPGIAYKFGKSQRIFARISLTNSLPKYGDEIKPYGYLNFAGGIRIL